MLFSGENHDPDTVKGDGGQQNIRDSFEDASEVAFGGNGFPSLQSETHSSSILARREFTKSRGFPSPRTVWTITILLGLIAFAAATRRTLFLVPVVLGTSTGNPGSLDAGFARHAVLTLVHIAAGVAFLVLGPLQFWRPKTGWHRWRGRVFFTAGLVIGISALAMSFQTSIGGATETAATTFFALYFLFALGMSLRHILAKRIRLHREWMIRAFAIGLAIATIRPIVGVFFAFSRITHQTPQEIFGIAFWLGFTIHLIVAEAYIRKTAG